MLSINAGLNLKWRFGGQQSNDFHFFFPNVFREDHPSCLQASAALHRTRPVNKYKKPTVKFNIVGVGAFPACAR